MVICCHQSAERIGYVLEGLLAQVSADAPWELVLVDNACTDDTVALAQRMWRLAGVPLRVVREERTGLVHGRRAGLAAATYELLAFLDDDTVPAEDWLWQVLRHFRRYPDSGALGGFNALACESEPPDWFPRFQHSWAVGPQAAEDGEVFTLWGAGLVVRSEAWRELRRRRFPFRCVGRKGGDLGAGEDSELVAALRSAGWKARYDSSVRLTHRLSASRLSLGYARRLYHGFGQASVWMDPYWRRGSGRPWLLELWLEVAVYLRKLLARLASRAASPEEEAHRILDLARQRGRISGLWRAGSAYDRHFREVARVLSSLP